MYRQSSVCSTWKMVKIQMIRNAQAPVSDTSIGNFQPMNVNFGIMTPLGYKVKGKANKNLAIAERSLAIIDQMVREHNV